MPSTSKAQQHLMAAAEHGATFPLAKKLRASMTHQQLHDFAATKTKSLPTHVKKTKSKRGAPLSSMSRMARVPNRAELPGRSAAAVSGSSYGKR